jgi:hypothetical protein
MSQPSTDPFASRYSTTVTDQPADAALPAEPEQQEPDTPATTAEPVEMVDAVTAEPVEAAAPEPVEPESTAVAASEPAEHLDEPFEAVDEPLSEQAEAVESFVSLDDTVPATDAGSGADTIDELGLGLSEEPTPGYVD